MYAVVKTGGKQYRVSPGDSVEVEKLPYEVGEQIELDQVLLVANGSDAQIGRPLVEGAKVNPADLGIPRPEDFDKWWPPEGYKPLF